MKLYNRIKDLREDADKSQKQIAEIIGTSQSYYAQYENDKRPIPFDRAIMLADYYSVSLDYIAGRTNDKKGFNKSDLPKPEFDLIKKFRSLSPERQSRILERVDMLYEEQEDENAKRKEAV